MPFGMSVNLVTDNQEKVNKIANSIVLTYII